LTPICSKSFVGCGFAPDHTGGAYSPPGPLAVFRGLTSKGERRMEGREFVLCPANKKRKVGAYVFC